MANMLSARRLYRDGYQLDGYEVAELVDGYQIGSQTMNLGDAARLERNLRKVSLLIQRAEQEAKDPTVFRPIATPVSLPLYKALLEQTRGAQDKANLDRLKELRAKYAARSAAIGNADGYVDR